MFTHKSTFALIATILIYFSSVQTFDKNMVLSFFKLKSVQNGYIFGCFSSKETKMLATYYIENHLRITVNNVNDYEVGCIVETSFYHYGIIVDGDCANVQILLKKAGESLLFDDIHHWLITSSNDSILSNLKLNINSDLYAAKLNTNNSKKNQNWTITDVYNPAHNHGGKLNIDNIGFYSKEEGFQIKRNGNKYWRRKNLTGVVFKTVVVLRQPFVGTIDEYLEHGQDRKADSYSRFNCKLMYYCKNFYNFSFKINITDTWGYEVAKGKYDGATGMLARKEIDFGCSGLYLKPERVPIVDYGRGFWNFRAAFIFRQPIIRSFGQTFLHPMSTSVWLATLIATLLIIIVLKLNQKFEFGILKDVQGTLDQAWSTVILFTLGAFCQQGIPQTPALLCGRIITISILTFFLLFYQFYSGSIVSSLLTKPPPAIRNPTDLLNSPLKLASDGAPYLKNYFQTTTDPVSIALYKEKMTSPGNSLNFYPLEHGLKLVDDGGFAYHVEKSTAYKFIAKSFSDKAICELGEVQVFPTGTIMAAFHKKSPFRDMLNYCLQRLAEHGIGDYEKAHWGFRKPECFESSTSITFNVGLLEIYPAIVLLNIGILISLMVLAIEVFVKGRITKKQKKNKVNLLN